MNRRLEMKLFDQQIRKSIQPAYPSNTPLTPYLSSSSFSLLAQLSLLSTLPSPFPRTTLRIRHFPILYPKSLLQVVNLFHLSLQPYSHPPLALPAIHLQVPLLETRIQLVLSTPFLSHLVLLRPESLHQLPPSPRIPRDQS